MRGIGAAALALGLALAGCRGARDEEARAAVTGYVGKLPQAYRASDEEVVDALVTEPLGRKLTGLIGAKRDAGVVLDSRLLELSFERVEQDGEALLVDTRERWIYRDVRIGSGAQAGEESTDGYAVRYRLVREGGKLKVDGITFRVPPVVGRERSQPSIDTRTAHGLPPEAEERAGPRAPSPPAVRPVQPGGAR
jgi:hypothetical protein